MMGKKILFINQEISPYIADNEMSLLGKLFPQKIQEAGYEIRTFMPKWGTVNERRGQLHEVQRLSGMNLIIDDTDHPLIIKVASIQSARIQVYFLDNDDYFPKKHVGENDDIEEENINGERAVFYARGVLETVKKLRWVPDLIVCQGWMSALVPLYIKKAYNEEPSFVNTKIITLLFDNQPKELLEENFRKCIEFKDIKEDILDNYSKDFDYNEFVNLAIDYSDGIIAASKDLDQSIKKHLKTKKIPKLKYQGKDFTDEHKKFIESFLE